MIDRRQFLVGAAALVVVSSCGAPRLPRREPTARPSIRARSDWADDPPLWTPPTEDPRIVVVHHTASSNVYSPSDVPGILRTIYRNHTGHYSGGQWPDIAYNFIVDQFGTIWEARVVSADGPVAGDATGGNQGHSILCCWLGTHDDEPPSQPAIDAMVSLIAWQAARYRITVGLGATATFASRGSSLWPEGDKVTVPTVCGHRDVSDVTCPGDAGYEVVGSLPALVRTAYG